MNEREHHDRHYAHDAEAIQAGALFQRVHARTVRQFLRATAAGPRHRVLSLGCGDGSIERRLAPYVGQIVGLDLSPVAIAKADAAASAAGMKNISFHLWQSELSTDGLLKGFGRFDVIAAFAFLHHLPDEAIAQALVAARMALRPGGFFFATDPSRRRLVRIFVPLARRAYERYHSPDEHELDPDGIARLALQAGFQPVLVRYSDYFMGPLAWLAPATPNWLARVFQAVDDVALRLPLARRYASSYSLVAQAP